MTEIEQVLAVLVKRTPTYLDELARLTPSEAERVKDVEIRFMIAVFQCRRFGRADGFDSRSMLTLWKFLRGKNNPLRLIGPTHFIAALRAPPGFVFATILENVPDENCLPANLQFSEQRRAG